MVIERLARVVVASRKLDEVQPPLPPRWLALRPPPRKRQPRRLIPRRSRPRRARSPIACVSAWARLLHDPPAARYPANSDRAGRDHRPVRAQVVRAHLRRRLHADNGAATHRRDVDATGARCDCRAVPKAVAADRSRGRSRCSISPTSPGPSRRASPRRLSTASKDKRGAPRSPEPAQPGTVPPPTKPDHVVSPAERAILERLSERRDELEARARDLDMRESLLEGCRKAARGPHQRAQGA